ncbi:MAG: DNA gyrase subunit A [Patescibacteria group bacterium]|jgi:DNA gyrase subunit A
MDKDEKNEKINYENEINNPEEESEKKSETEDSGDIKSDEVQEGKNLNPSQGDSDVYKTDHGLVKNRDIVSEMQSSYLDYAMSVIVSRALPDVRDGLKPSQRRILVAMNDLNLTHRSKHRKCAKIAGDTSGNYHPHGEQVIYPTLVHMAQDFSMRYRLVDGQGNFGSIDGDEPAAMRYTEARMTAISEEMLADINKETVDWQLNYDATRKEPKVLPARVPQLIINGQIGIAVGMATNIAPHNLTEVCEGIEHLIDHPEATVDDLMQFVKGPDFPTAGNIYNINEIKAAYATGKGAIVMRAEAKIEEGKKGFKIIITEIPYQVNKSVLITKIADLVKEKKIEGISDIRDESDRTEGIRIVLYLKSNAYPKKILNRLFESTQMQTTFHVNMLALNPDYEPRIMTLKNIFTFFIDHRRIVIRRRVEYDLKKAKERAHVLEGLRIALKNIDAVIETIKKSKDRSAALKNLMEKFKLSEIQSNAILDMRLSQLAALEQENIEKEYQEKLRQIAEYEDILAHEEKILAIIKDDLVEIKEKYGDARKTRIHPEAIGKFEAVDLIPNEQVIITLTKTNYIKRLPEATYRIQGRGGKGVTGMSIKEDDSVQIFCVASTHDDILFFTDKGKLFRTKVYEVPQSARQSKGTALVNIIQIGQDEKVTAMLTIGPKTKAKYLVMGTRGGVIKKTEIEAYKNVRKTGILAFKLRENDKLSWVALSSGNDQVFEATAQGQAILYSEKQVRPMGRSAAGVRGIKLRSNDTVIGMDVVNSEDLNKTPDIMIVTERGLGKRTLLSHYRNQNRGGFGIKTANVTTKTGPVVSAYVVIGTDGDLLMVSKDGQTIRMALSDVKRLGRDTQGVTLMRLNKNDIVATVTVFENEKEDSAQPQLNLDSPPDSKPPKESNKKNEPAIVEDNEDVTEPEDVVEEVSEPVKSEKNNKEKSTNSDDLNKEEEQELKNIKINSYKEDVEMDGINFWGGDLKEKEPITKLPGEAEKKTVDERPKDLFKPTIHDITRDMNDSDEVK